VENGFSAFTFDYATFGWSAGWPRHQVKPQKHVKDLQAALSYVRTDLANQADASRIGLWGTSMGGGHVLSVASGDSDIRAVVANVPHVKSALESIIGTLQREPILTSIGLVKVLGALIKWSISQLLNGTTTYIPLHGQPGSSAMMQNKGDDEGYSSMIHDNARAIGWKNFASVGSVLPSLFYRPINKVHNISSPALLIAAENDTLCSADSAYVAAKQMNPDQTKVVTLHNAGHFDVYDGAHLELSLNETVKFFLQHV